MKEVKAKSLEKTYGDNKKAGEEFMANIAKKPVSRNWPTVYITKSSKKVTVKFRQTPAAWK